MAAKFDQKDYFNIFFTDETKRTISKINIGKKPKKEEEKPTGEEKMEEDEEVMSEIHIK